LGLITLVYVAFAATAVHRTGLESSIFNQLSFERTHPHTTTRLKTYTKNKRRVIIEDEKLNYNCSGIVVMYGLDGGKEMVNMGMNEHLGLGVRRGK
jgi:hypothetical protein